MIIGTARRILGSARTLAVAGALALACALGAAPAWAAEAHPVQSAIETGVSGACIVNVVGLTGGEGETVYITLRQGGTVIADLAPHAIGKGGIADMFALEADGVAQLEDSLAAGVTVAVYADEAGSDLLYEGSVWPVYADLGDAGTKLIGTHTGASGFSAPATMTEAGQAYRLAGAAEQSGDEALEFPYEPYTAAGSADGSIRYVDVRTGKALSYYTPIPGLAAGEAARAVAIPQIVESDGKVYRTVSFDTAVHASNPDATAFTVPAAELGDSAAAAAGHYMAVIEFVDAETGATIASDAVWVRGDVSYTTPDTIYKAAGSASDAAEYGRAAGEPAVLALSAKDDGVTTGSRTIRVRYGLAAPGEGAAATFALIDGSKRAGDAGRTIGSVEGELPPATYTDASGNEFELVGEPADYGPLATGVADAYYLPKGWSGAQEPYTVTVSYVDWSTREVVDTEEFASSPDDLADIAFEPPAQFERDGATWLRLDGQDRLTHNYWSKTDKYTVYYRDRSKPIESAPVITQVRVVYRDEGTTVASNGTANAGTAATGAGTANAGAAAGTANAAAGTGASDERLDSGRAYNVAEGEGASQRAVGQDGRDATQQRIDEAETPLADGTSGPVETSAPAGPAGQPAQGLPAPAIAGIVIGVIAVIALIAALLRRRRNG